MIPRKYGKIKASKEFVNDMIINKDIRLLFSELIALDIHTDMFTSTIEYTCWSEHFRKLNETEQIPDYKISFNYDRESDQKYSMTVTDDLHMYSMIVR